MPVRWAPGTNDSSTKRLMSNLDFFFQKNFEIFFPSLKVLKVRRLGRKTSGFWTVRILKICRTSRQDVMSGRALIYINKNNLQKDSAVFYVEN